MVLDLKQHLQWPLINDDDDLFIYHWLFVLMISLSIIVLLHLQWPLIGTLITTPAGLSDLNYFWSDSLSCTLHYIFWGCTDLLSYTLHSYMKCCTDLTSSSSSDNFCAQPAFLEYEAKYHITVYIFNHIVNQYSVHFLKRKGPPQCRALSNKLCGRFYEFSLIRFLALGRVPPPCIDTMMCIKL